MKRKLGIIAAAALSTMAFSQLVSADQDNVTAARSASSTSRFRVVVNPDESGYRGPVTLDNGYRTRRNMTDPPVFVID